MNQLAIRRGAKHERVGDRGDVSNGAFNLLRHGSG